MCDLTFRKELFENYRTATILDKLLSTYEGIPKGVNYMSIGDPGVGKTTIILDMLANIRQNYPKAKVLFISAEMNEIDLHIYVERFPKFKYLDILFVESDPTKEFSNWENMVEILAEGWDIVAIDSFYELQGIVREEENCKMREAESMILSLIKKHNKAENARAVHTTFITIQQVTKSGVFVGSNRLKHMITAMMELRLENPKNIYSDRFVTFSKHRRGDVGVKLYYNLSAKGDVFYDHERYTQDQRIKQMQNNVTLSLRSYADEFDQLFNA